MFKRRRRSAGSTATDLPFCAMCGQTIRVDSSSGRCALGHRVAVTAAAPEPVLDTAVASHATAPVEALGGYVDERIAAFTADRTYDPYAETATEQAPVWDTADDATAGVGGLEDFMSWDTAATEETSALDIDTAELPTAEPTSSTADLLDELGTPAFAQQRTA